MDERLRWQTHRQAFFVKQRLYSLLSVVLLDNAASGRLRAALLRLGGASIGRKCVIRRGLILQESFRLRLGDRVFINAGCCFDCSMPITVGDDVQLAYQVTLITGNHRIGGERQRAGPHTPRPIVIGSGAWIGARAIILPGVTVGDGAVVAAGAVVTRDVPPNTLVAGIPAAVVRSLP